MNMQVNTKNGIDLKNNQKQTLCFYFYVIIEVIRCKEVAFSIITADSWNHYELPLVVLTDGALTYVLQSKYQYFQ